MTSHNSQNDNQNDNYDPFARDHELDELLRDWHRENTASAEAGRARITAHLAAAAPAPVRPWRLDLALRNVVLSPWTRAAATIALLIACASLVLPRSGTEAYAGAILVPEGGRLEARDTSGAVLGPCPLAHTDVDVSIAGRFAQVNLTQRYHNPYDVPIEAVYTFPLSHSGAVHAMRMTIGDRVVIGTVKERGEARRTYEAARDQGYVTALLEQERPNIFTQSVANIEPGAEVLVEISYVETIPVRDGVFEFVFPMTVAPRYIPGAPASPSIVLPAELVARYGVILRAPATFTLGQPGVVDDLGALHSGRVTSLLSAAIAIETPGTVWWGEGVDMVLPPVWYPVQVDYHDGIREIGWFYTDGTGQINGRWFYTDPAHIRSMGLGFSPDTTQVPDASHITPMPARPGTRAGHEVSINVTLDVGGAGLKSLDAQHHDLDGADVVNRLGEPVQRVECALSEHDTIPNRDFILRWRHATETLHTVQFAATPPAGTYGTYNGGFFTLMIEPPARVSETDIMSRELVFVLDSSGSMENFPIEKAKALIALAIKRMRPADLFNIVSFNNSTDRLYESPRPANDERRAEALKYIDARHGGGGTEMKAAVIAALDRSIAPLELQDGRERTRYVLFVTDGEIGNDRAVVDAVRNASDATRMFTIGIGSSPNRSLMDAMAKAGRGASDYLSLNGDAGAVIDRFVTRIERPVLTDITITPSPGLELLETVPPLDAMPDLFDVSPLIVHGRYRGAARGTLTITGRTAGAPYTQVLAVDLPAEAAASAEHAIVPLLWARAKMDELTKAKDRNGIIDLGTSFSLMSAHTSFVAVEHTRMIVGGAPMLVAVPIEMPLGQEWSGTFGALDPAFMKRHQDAQQAQGVLNVGGEQFDQLVAQLMSDSSVGDLAQVEIFPGTNTPDSGRITFAWKRSERGRASGLTSLGDVHKNSNVRYSPGRSATSGELVGRTVRGEALFDDVPELDLNAALRAGNAGSGRYDGRGGGGMQQDDGFVPIGVSNSSLDLLSAVERATDLGSSVLGAVPVELGTEYHIAPATAGTQILTVTGQTATPMFGDIPLIGDVFGPGTRGLASVPVRGSVREPELSTPPESHVSAAGFEAIDDLLAELSSKARQPPAATEAPADTTPVLAKIPVVEGYFSNTTNDGDSDGGAAPQWSFGLAFEPTQSPGATRFINELGVKIEQGLDADVSTVPDDHLTTAGRAALRALRVLTLQQKLSAYGLDWRADAAGQYTAGNSGYALETLLLAVIRLIERDALGRAALLLEAIEPLASQHPQYRALDELLRRTDLDPAERLQHAAIIKAAIQQQLRAAVLKHQAELQMVQVIAPALRPAAFGGAGHETPVTVAVLVTEINATQLSDLRRAGLAVEATTASRSVIVGTIAPHRLLDLAKTTGVRRIERVGTE